MILLLLGVGVFFALHGIRDLMQYAGRENVFTKFMRVADNRKMEVPSAIVSFSVALFFFWAGLA